MPAVLQSTAGFLQKTIAETKKLCYNDLDCMMEKCEQSMEFTGFLGNEQLKTRLRGMFRREKASHCYLISGPDGSGKHTLATLLAAALQCTGGEVPCRRCPQCRKVFSGSHPDLVTVDDETRKTLPVAQIRAVCADVFIRPNEGKRKIYLFPHAEKLTPACQNTLLKVLEEPPAYAVFLLLAPNPGLLLPTVRSRCAELHLSPLPESVLLPALRQRCPGHGEDAYRQAAASGYLGQAVAALEQTEPSPKTAAFLEAFAARDALGMLETLTSMEKWKREQLLPVLQEWEALLTKALSARCGAPVQDQALQAVRDRRTAREILEAVEALRQAEVWCNANVGAGAICGALAVKL